MCVQVKAPHQGSPPNMTHHRRVKRPQSIQPVSECRLPLSPLTIPPATIFWTLCEMVSEGWASKASVTGTCRLSRPVFQLSTGPVLAFTSTLCKIQSLGSLLLPISFCWMKLRILWGNTSVLERSGSALGYRWCPVGRWAYK